MTTAILLSLAAEIGAPMVQQILARKIGQGNADLVADVIARIAAAAGVPPEVLPEIVDDQPDVVRDAILEVEAMTPELIALYSQGLEFQMAQLKSEEGESGFMRGWRPGFMYLLLFLCFWNAVGLHVLNAIFKVALPPMPWDVLIQLTAIYAGLYMGGHTIKDAVGKWAAHRQGA